MKVIHLIDSLSGLNYGVWNSIIINFDHLRRQDIHSELWFPAPGTPPNGVVSQALKSGSVRYLRSLIKLKGLDPAIDVVVTHGAWNYPTRWGFALRKMGFRWIYVPHGMLEPWPMQQKWIKKKLYFALVEKQLANKADFIRAVSLPEMHNLQKTFPGRKVGFIPNGVDVADLPVRNFQEIQMKKRYLFLSRLHHKKNIVALAEAWQTSALGDNNAYELVIAGPDEGELKPLKAIIGTSSNIRYVGPVFGADKKGLFNQSHFFVLPSYSEGLPSAVLEAMAHGLVPIITEGCNFPDAFEHSFGAKITTDKTNIQMVLEETARWREDVMEEKSMRGQSHIIATYSLEAVTEQQLKIFRADL